MLCSPLMGTVPEPILLRYRGRDLTSQDVASIRTAIATYYERGRTYIGLKLCEQWQWRQANGEYKAFAARDLLRRLEQEGLVELPAPQRVKVNYPPGQYEQIPLFVQTPLGGILTDHPAPVLREAHGPDSYLGLPAGAVSLPGSHPAGRGASEATGLHRRAGRRLFGMGERGLEDRPTRPAYRVEPGTEACAAASVGQ